MDSINSIHENEEINNELKGLLLKLRKYWYFILIGFLIGVLSGVIIKFILTPQYKASSLVYLRSGESSISLQDLQIGSELTKDYEVIFKSRPNLEKIINKLKLDYSYGELYNMITITNLTKTRILKIEVVSDSPDLSKDIANEVVYYGMDSVREIDSQEPYLVEKAITNNNTISTSLTTLISIGGLLGIIIAFGIILLRVGLSENIQSIEDVEKSLNLPVLAVVMEDKALSYKKKSNNKRKRNR